MGDEIIIQSVQKFEQEYILKDYIAMNSRLRQASTTEINKQLYTDLIYICSGKSFQNPMTYSYVEMLTNSQVEKSRIHDPFLRRCEILIEDELALTDLYHNTMKVDTCIQYMFYILEKRQRGGYWLSPYGQYEIKNLKGEVEDQDEFWYYTHWQKKPDQHDWNWPSRIGVPLPTNKLVVDTKRAANDKFGSTRASTIGDMTEIEDHQLHIVSRNLVENLAPILGMLKSCVQPQYCLSMWTKYQYLSVFRIKLREKRLSWNRIEGVHFMQL